MFTIPVHQLAATPMYHKLQPQPVYFQANVEPVPEGAFMCEVTLAARRRYVETETYDVYLPRSTDKVVRLRPAFGETRRNPQKFVAVVLIDGNPKRARTVAISAGQKLQVI